MTALFLKDQTGIFLLFLAQGRNTVQMAMVAVAYDPAKSTELVLWMAVSCITETVVLLEAFGFPPPSPHFFEWPGCNLRQIVALCLLAAWDEVSWGMVAARFQIDGVSKPQSKICWQQNDPPWGIRHNMLSRFLGQLPASHSYISNNYPSWGRRKALALAADDCLNKCV